MEVVIPGGVNRESASITTSWPLWRAVFGFTPYNKSAIRTNLGEGGTREESDSHGFGEDGVPVLKNFRSRDENAVSVGGKFLRFDCVCDCFCDEKVSLCLEAVCDEKEVARKRSEG